MLGDNITQKMENDMFCISFSDGYKEAFLMSYCPEYELALVSLLEYASIKNIKRHDLGYLYYLYVLSIEHNNQDSRQYTDDDCVEDWVHRINDFIRTIDPKREYHL